VPILLRPCIVCCICCSISCGRPEQYVGVLSLPVLGDSSKQQLQATVRGLTMNLEATNNTNNTNNEFCMTVRSGNQTLT
jgi:hypothetical protein